MSNNSSSCKAGYVVGFYVAGYLSWITHKSIAWCLFHAYCGFFYTVYWLFEYGSK